MLRDHKPKKDRNGDTILTPGDIESEVFSMLEAGRTPREIVISLHIPADDVARIWELWKVSDDPAALARLRRRREDEQNRAKENEEREAERARRRAEQQERLRLRLAEINAAGNSGRKS